MIAWEERINQDGDLHRVVLDDNGKVQLRVVPHRDRTWRIERRTVVRDDGWELWKKVMGAPRPRSANTRAVRFWRSPEAAMRFAETVLIMANTPAKEIK